MVDDNWQKIRKIFDNALLQRSEERARFVDVACGGDKTLLREVESLLSSLGDAKVLWKRRPLPKLRM